jgi:hypothetical protein
MRKAIMIAAALALSACATTPKAVTGAYPIGEAYSITLGDTWADVSGLIAGRPKGVHLLTVDGPQLNRLYITEGLDPGAFIVKPLNKESPTPTYRAGLSQNELVEFVTDTVAALDYQHAEATNLRPANFGAARSVRFDLTAQTKKGLNVSGAAQIAESGGKAYVMLYLAPSEHYYAASLAEVEKAFTSATLK